MLKGPQFSHWKRRSESLNCCLDRNGSLWCRGYAPICSHPQDPRNGEGGGSNRLQEWQGLWDWCLHYKRCVGINCHLSTSLPWQGYLLRLWEHALLVALKRRQVFLRQWTDKAEGSYGLFAHVIFLSSPSQLLYRHFPRGNFLIWSHWDYGQWLSCIAMALLFSGSRDHRLLWSLKGVSLAIKTF